MKLPIPLTILNVFGFLLFAAFSWVQHNDTDPAIYDHPSRIDAWLWLLFYGLIAILFAWTLFLPLSRWAMVLAALACLIELTRTAPGLWENIFGALPFTMTQTSMSATDPRVELSREFFGALIALAAIGTLWWEQQQLKNPSRMAGA